MGKGNVSKNKLLEWDRFSGENVGEAIPKLYADAAEVANEQRGWYWQSIRNKRRWSLGSRGASYVLALLGVAAPLLSAVFASADDRLLWTQVGVAALALAGAVQLGDKVFGWSSGWLRYITTVTAMERAVLQFELGWASYFLMRAGPYTLDDLKVLFEMAKQLQVELERRRSEETDGWVVEFNSGMTALNEVIRLQRDATDKAAATTKVAVEARDAALARGAIEVAIGHKNGTAVPVTVYVDDKKHSTFTGVTWAVREIAPAIHVIRIVREDPSGTVEATGTVTVAPASVAKLQLTLP